MSEPARQSVPSLQDWATARSQVKAKAAKMKGDPRKVITNALHLADTCEEFEAPQAIGKGYWDTVTVHWKGIEVEVFGDRLELYRFHSKGTDIEHFSLTSDGCIPEDFLSALRIAFDTAK